MAPAEHAQNILDLTPAGRGLDWYPKLHYPATA